MSYFAVRWAISRYADSSDARVGASYTRRWMNEWIEDMSRDNLQTFILGNPGYGIAQDFPKAERTYGPELATERNW